ncbi:MAG: tRNA (adenosine(37)-N6)-threonylcarbamoyltransferase complex ATPase subunit type 1 TsaE [bacterium]|nr:tRNA (adenosine(37)-N6)-threonylcarbamoyltransferase complex ATPase subunit type 1 TsaE [bacterium]MDZ4231243.1 tRNA (adenosine(37)-N6)-threonylcarbamoyltransferase complex ATPase subunit type 1 TsaE [Patescibacteria group bacterium]
MKRYTTKGAKDTQRLAKEILEEAIQKAPKKGALILALEGELGAGKTTFTQALAKALGVKRRILSPTFLVMKRFPLPKQSRFKNLYHIDAYRVGIMDLKVLGVEKILNEPGIVVIEWADRIKGILPKGTLWVKFEHGRQENERQITFN